MTAAAIQECAEQLALLGLDPIQFRADGSAHDPIVTIRFQSLHDLTQWCQVEKAKITRESKVHIQGHVYYYACYDRPGRRMLVEARIFPHMPEWAEVQS